MKKMILLLNHELTQEQREDAKSSFGIESFIYPDNEVKELWMNIDPDGEEIPFQVKKAVNWLKKVSSTGDFVLVQGEYGAVFYTVDYCFNQGLIPVYATSKRIYEEQTLANGSIERKHIFRHVKFRRYIKCQNIQ